MAKKLITLPQHESLANKAKRYTLSLVQKIAETSVAALEEMAARIVEAPANHNGIFRGKNLTGVYTVEELYQKVSKGDFSDLYLGDYITITMTNMIAKENTPFPEAGWWIDTVTENVDLMIAAFDYYYNTGDTPLTKHHLVLIPRAAGFKTTGQMNLTDTTDGGYLNSNMHQVVLPQYVDGLKEALNDHLLTHRSWLTNSVTDTAASMAGAGKTGCASGCEWATVELQLMNEVQMFGSTVWSSSAYDVGIDNRKLPVFDFISPIQYSRAICWLRSVAFNGCFAYCDYVGTAQANSASNANYVRPLMLFG